MKYLRQIISIPLLFLLAGCAKNPVKEFESMVLESIKIEAENPKVGNRNEVIIQDIEYDVSQTDSMVSPYVAELNYLVLIYDDSEEVEEELKEMLSKEPSERAAVKINFAFQESQWVWKNITVNPESVKASSNLESKRSWAQMRLEGVRDLIDRGYNASQKDIDEVEGLAKEINTLESVLAISNIGLKLMIIEHAEKVFFNEKPQEETEK